MRHILVAISFFILGSTLVAAASFKLTNSEKEVRDSLIRIIPIGSNAIKGKTLLEQNGFACFIAKDKDFLNNEKLNYIYCIYQSWSDSASERWQILVYHSNEVVKGIEVKYDLVDE